ncbi:MAG: hypothetical protein GTN81_13885 [Proteobacteria bacterium]|nr:hypothetical protein [Pseudomonadota bacterium]
MRILSVPFCVGIFALSTNLSLASTDYDESLAIQKGCGLSGVSCSNKAFEKKQIDRFSEKVTRHDGDLKLNITAGPPVILRNITANDTGNKVYWFMTYYRQIGYFLVQVHGWEGFHYLMINGSTGDPIPLIGVPIVSRDTKRFIVTSLDIEAGYRPNRIAIFRFIGDRVELEWSKGYTASGPSDAIWINDTLITYSENSSPDGAQTLNKEQMSVILENGEWRIVTGNNP